MTTETIRGLIVMGSKDIVLLNPGSLDDFAKRNIVPMYLGVTDYENPALKQEPAHEYIRNIFAEIPDVDDDTYIGNLFNFRFADQYLQADLSVSTKFKREAVLRALASFRYNKFKTVPRFIPVARGGRITTMCEHNSRVTDGTKFDVRLTSFHFIWR